MSAPDEHQASAVALPEPRIIPRSQHNISRKNIDPDAVKVMYRLHRHGFLAYLVGGGVRDLLLGKRPKDFDVGTDARPGEVRKLFRNSRIIGRRFRLVQVFFRGGKIIEVSTFRRAADPDEDGILQANNTFGTPAEDALRRDLTINAIFYNIADFSLVDYVGGLDDLRAGLIRGVGDPLVRFRRDPVRILRAIRHAARTGFKLAPETWQAVTTLGDHLALCPTSRLRDELMRDLTGGSSAAWLELAHRSGVLYHLLPNLRPVYGQDPSPARTRARELLARIDAAWSRGELPDDAVVVAALLWPALEEAAAGQDLPPGRAGRVAWTQFARQELPRLAQPLAFTKRVMERCRQMAGVMAYLRDPRPGMRLPKRVTDKGYFLPACRLARLLGRDLASLAAPAAGKTSTKKKKRRRRRRRRPRPAKPVASREQ